MYRTTYQSTSKIKTSFAVQKPMGPHHFLRLLGERCMNEMLNSLGFWGFGEFLGDFSFCRVFQEF